MNEQETKRAVRKARADLMTTPAWPVKSIIILDGDGPPESGYLCAGCMMAIEPGVAWCDAQGWLWCTSCAASDVHGAVLTRDEYGRLFQLFADAAARHGQVAAKHNIEKCRLIACGDCDRTVFALEAAAEVRELRNVLAPAWESGAAYAPNPWPVNLDIP